MKAYIVDSGAVRSNLQALMQRAGDASFWAVLKGNGYGLGLVQMATLCRGEGVTRFAVTELWEANLLRSSGFSSEQILMLRPTADQEEIRQLLNLNVILTVSSPDDAAAVNAAASARPAPARVHIKIDTGMGRYGFLPDETDKLASVFENCPCIHVEGIYTHLHSAFCSRKATLAQAEAFRAIVSALDARGFDCGEAHMLNSAGLLRFPEYAMDGVRIGSAILGRGPVRGSFGLQRVGVCEATVEELRWLPKGHTCGYGAGWKARQATKIAVLSVGWYHGFGCEMGNDLFRFRDCARGVLRNLKNMIFGKHLYVTLNGKKCRVLGHIGMLHTVIDVTKISCAIGDTATLDINPLLLKGMEIVYR